MDGLLDFSHYVPPRRATSVFRSPFSALHSCCRWSPPSDLSQNYSELPFFAALEVLFHNPYVPGMKKRGEGEKDSQIRSVYVHRHKGE